MGMADRAAPAEPQENVYGKKWKPQRQEQSRRPWRWGLSQVLNNKVCKIGADLANGAIFPRGIDPIGE